MITELLAALAAIPKIADSLDRLAGTVAQLNARAVKARAAKQTGSWRATTYAIQGDLLTAAGRKPEARAAYQNALAKPGLPKTWREAIEKSLQ